MYRWPHSFLQDDKSRRDKTGIIKHIIMHHVLYNVHVTLFMHNISHSTGMAKHYSVLEEILMITFILWCRGLLMYSTKLFFYASVPGLPRYVRAFNCAGEGNIENGEG